MSKPEKTTAAPSKPRPSKAAPPTAEELDTATAAISGDYLNKNNTKGNKNVLMNVRTTEEERYKLKLWCVTHGYDMSTVLLEGAKLFIKSKES